MVRAPSFGTLAAVFAAAAVAAGCDSIDPTEQAFGITFRSDTAQKVHLKLCSNDGCTHFDYSEGWKAGQSAEENVSDRQLLTRWLVEDDATGRALGCLPLEFDQKYENVLVNVSQMVPCPGRAPLPVRKGKALGRS